MSEIRAFGMENPTRELSEFMNLASAIRDISSDEEISFTIILLTFFVGKDPISRWFQEYVRQAGVKYEDLLAYKRIDPEKFHLLDKLDISDSVSLSSPLTTSVQNLLAQAEIIRATIGADSLNVPHLMGAFIYRPGVHEEQLAEWHFDRREWSEAFLAQMATFEPDRFEPWLALHTATFGAPPKSVTPPPPPESATPPPPPRKLSAGPARTHPDTPETQDFLGRKDFAQALASRLAAIWNANQPLADGNSFVMHLHGSWGAGKTSLLNFLEAALRDFKDKPWVVVRFNAWQHQHLTPTWWPFLDTIARESLENLPIYRLDLRLYEWMWRYLYGRLSFIICLLVSLIIFNVLLWSFYRAMGLAALPDVEAVLKLLLGLASLFGIIWSAISIITTHTLTSAGSVKDFLNLAEDPLGKVKAHFRKLIDHIKSPVIVFIDDLDRCSKEYTVNLLENLQTIFNYHKIFYVVAADRRWLYTCFEKIYEDFIGSIKEPGRRIGYLFIEKAFQLSVSVPRMSPPVLEKYFQYLQWADKDEFRRELEKNRSLAEAALEGKTTAAEVFPILEKIEAAADSFAKQTYRSVAVRHMVSPEAEQEAEYFLKPFLPYLEPNPRAMKRFVNAYIIYQALATMADPDLVTDESKRKQLALWTIISLRWPVLAEYLELNPELLEKVKTGHLGEEEKDIKELVNEAEVRRLFASEVGQSFDQAALLRLLSL